jgi:hypothetical protein
MTSSPDILYIEIHVPDAGTEQEFLQLAVQRAAKQYRRLHTTTSHPEETVIQTHALPQHPGPAPNAPRPPQTE